MKDEEKVRLKELVEKLWASEQEFMFSCADKETICSLLDKQMGDIEKEKASSALSNLRMGCSNWRGCPTCSVHDACKQGIDIIRIALGIEEPK